MPGSSLLASAEQNPRLPVYFQSAQTLYKLHFFGREDVAMLIAAREHPACTRASIEIGARPRLRPLHRRATRKIAAGLFDRRHKYVR